MWSVTTKENSTVQTLTLETDDAQRFENFLRARLGLAPLGTLVNAQMRLYGWVTTAVITLIAAVVRFVRLDSPNALIFDETYYVKGGYSMLHWGYERAWSDAEDLNDRVISALQSGSPLGSLVHDNPDHWVHPPFGKWLIGEGMRIAGDTSGYGWRFTTAICGVLVVALLVRITLRLFRSIPLAAIAGIFVALDGLALTMSRTGLLDNMISLFVLVAFWAILRDRDWSRARLAHRVAYGTLRAPAPQDTEPEIEPAGQHLATNDKSLADMMLSRVGVHHVQDDEPPIATHSVPDKPTTPDFETLSPQDPWGPSSFFRPWILLAAVFLGLSTSVKWSGLYVIAVFGLLIFVWGITARKAIGARLWFGAGTFREGIPAFVQLVPPAIVTYIAAFTPWFINPDGWDRQWATKQIAANVTLPPDEQIAMPLSWAPDVVNSWLHWHIESYAFHTSLSTPHNYQSQAWQWLLQWRPVSFYWKGAEAMPKGSCWSDECVSAITSIGNPLMWWAALAALFVVIAMAVIRRDWRAWAILAGYLALWAPWLNYTDRTIFQFYAVAFVPFVVLALVYGLAWMTDMLPSSERVTTGFPNRASKIFILIFVAVIVISSIFWLPLWLGIPVPRWFWQAHMWLPSWI